MLIKKQDVKAKYHLPKEVQFCKNCTISNQRPRITFNEKGVCSACDYSVFKRTIDWEEREKELIELCNRHRKSDGSYDVIVPVSGGKDGGRVAHQLKEKYGMHPLTVTWSPLIPTAIGQQNLRNFINSGFDNIFGTPNGKTNRILTQLAFIYLGDCFQPFIYGQTNFPLNIAVEKNISLIMYGENGEVEYGGDMKNAFSPTREITDHNKHYFSNFPPEVWTEYGIDQKELFPYQAPPLELIQKNKTEIHFLGYYQFWDPQENFYYCQKNTGFTPNPERSEGTYSKYASLDDQLDGYHYYFAFIKFGIGRATSDTAHEIRDGKITREEGIALVRKYDGEFPKKYFQTFLDYINLSEQDFWEIVNSWRSDYLWEKSHGEWKLKYSIADENAVNT